MSYLNLPKGNTYSEEAAYSRDTLVKLLSGASGSLFTGYLKISTGDLLLLLFIFQGQPFAAGLLLGKKISPLTITNFCSRLADVSHGSGLISLHETDPVLLKSLLVMVQNRPYIHGPVNTIDLKDRLSSICSDGSDAMIMLENCGYCNFFYFYRGTKISDYWSDPQFKRQADFSVDKQMLSYTSGEASCRILALVYQQLNAMESPDAFSLTLEGLVRLFMVEDEKEQIGTEGSQSVNPDDQLVLKVLEGARCGICLGGAIPSVLGKKNSDILIDDPLASDRHAAIQIINGRLLLIDLQSTHGTTINNEPVSQMEIKQGDRIGIGSTVLLVQSINLT